MKGDLMRLAMRNCILVVPIFFCCVSVLGQEGLSTIRGTVTDPSGALVPKPIVSLDEVETNIRVRAAVSDEQGNFEMPGLKLGT
jgi:hypothetical protein